MTDKFDVNKYRLENDRTRLSTEQKNRISAQMRQAESAMKNKKNTRKSMWIKAAAAAIAVAVVGSSAYMLAGKSSREGFVITVKAADYKNAETATYPADTSVVGAFASTGGDNGECMEQDLQGEEHKAYTKDGYADYFASCPLQELQVVGKNIKSVRFSSAKKGVYFAVDASCSTQTDKNGEDYYQIGGRTFRGDKYKSSKDAKAEYLKSFSDYDSLNNSQYTVSEFRQHYVNGGEIWCDGFTYSNPDVQNKLQSVLPENQINLVIEADHSDPEIQKLYKEWQVNSEKSRESYDKIEAQVKEKYLAAYEKAQSEGDKAALSKINGEAYDELNKELERYNSSAEYSEIVKTANRLADEFASRTLAGATINVTVTYADGTAETQTVNVNYRNGTLRFVRG